MTLQVICLRSESAPAVSKGRGILPPPKETSSPPKPCQHRVRRRGDDGARRAPRASPQPHACADDSHRLTHIRKERGRTCWLILGASGKTERERSEAGRDHERSNGGPGANPRRDAAAHASPRAQAPPAAPPAGGWASYRRGGCASGLLSPASERPCSLDACLEGPRVSPRGRGRKCGRSRRNVCDAPLGGADACSRLLWYRVKFVNS